MLKFKVKEADNGEFYVVFTGANGEPWYVSETYTRKADAKRSADDFVTALLKEFGIKVDPLLFDSTILKMQTTQ